MTRRSHPLAAALLLALAAPAGALELAVTIEPGTLTVGDRAEVVLTVLGERDEVLDEPRFPAWGESWGEAEIVEAGPVEPAFGVAEAEGLPRLFRQRLVVTAFRPGTIELPPRRVAVPGADGPDGTIDLRTPDDLALVIDSVLPAELAEVAASELEVRPPAPPRQLPLGKPFWATLAGGSAILLGLFWIARRRRRIATAPPAAAPGDELAAALAAAESSDPESGHVRVSHALRRFLGRSFGFPAVESTTSEIRRRLGDRRAPAATTARVHEVLAACDRVKFAGEPASREALGTRIAAVREIAREVERHLRPPDDETAGGTARRERAA